MISNLIPYDKVSVFLTSEIVEGKFILSFEEYIKSQLYRNVFARNNGRSLLDYGIVYEHLTGKRELPKAYSVCLRYYYEDILSFILHHIKSGKCIEGFELELVIEDPIDCFNALDVDLGALKESLSDILSSKSTEYDMVASGVLSRFNLEELETLQASKMLAMASALHYSLSSTQLFKVRWQDRVSSEDSIT